MIPQFQQLLPFSLLFLTMMGTLTLPILYLVLKKNPVIWFLIDFIFLKSTRVSNKNGLMEIQVSYPIIHFAGISNSILVCLHPVGPNNCMALR